MAHDIFCGVDGTGVDSSEEYAREFANSHVNMLFKTWGTSYKWYSRGPTMMGSETFALAMGMASQAAIYYKQLSKKLGPDQKPRIFLSGYSRGGAAATAACDLLNKANIDVHCLLLFDAVDRTDTLDAAVIPPNVKFAYHAMRNPKSASREIFGNCATTKKGTPPLISNNSFHCTHGGMGGTPFPKDQVGLSGTIVEADWTQTLGASAGLAALIPIPGMGISEGVKQAYKLRTTNVTPTQDAAGSKAVKAWMTANLSAALAAP